MSLITTNHDTRTRNETQLFHRLHVLSTPIRLHRRSGSLRLVFVICWGLLVSGIFLPVRPLSAMPISQTTATGAAFTLPVVTPANGAVTLHTHIATIAFESDAQGTAILSLNASYDLRNESREPIQLPLRIANADPVELILSVNGASLPVAVSDNGEASAQVVVPAGGAAQLALAVRRSLAGSDVAQINYPTELLRQWRGQRSIRIEVKPGATLENSAWLRIEPDSWVYAPFADAIELEWMFEGAIPPRVLFETVTPSAWQELRQLTSAASAAAPAAYAALAERYQRVAIAAAQVGNQAAEERFWGQAVAAYTEGIRQAEAAGVSPVEVAGLHAGLASLYRTRIAGTDSALYAQAMTAEAALALRGVMVDDPRRAELEQWQIDGLRLMLADLRRRGDIPGALALIEQLRTLPGAEGSGGAFLEQERQALIVQQAVQLVEEGDRSTALELAGDLINTPTLQPPAEYRNLFTRWNVFATVSVDDVEVRVDVHLNLERADEAQAVLDEIVHTWRTTPALRALDPQIRRAPPEDESSIVELSLRIPTGDNGLALARTLPSSTEWALLRQFLSQLGPQIRTQTNGIWQRVQVSQPLDLRTAGEEWRRIAVELERQAETFEQQATQAGAATMQASQEARLRAANYRYTAQAWRDLAQNSQVMMSLSTPGATGDATRTWMVTVNSPPQMLNVQVDAISPARVLLAGLIALSAISGLAVLLWRLL